MVQWKLNLIDPQTLAEVVVWLVTHILQNKIQQDPRFLSRFYRPTKYLNYDIAYLRSHYRDESRALVDTPYSEMLLWLGESWDETVKRVKKTSVVVNPKRFRVISPIRELETFRSEALREFKQDGKATFNGHAIRLSQVEEREEEICLHVQPTRYYEQVKSNMVMDWEGPHSLQEVGIKTLRAYFVPEYGRKLPPLGDNRLANTMGVSAILYYRTTNGSTNGEIQYIPYLPRRVQLKPLTKDNKIVAVFDTGTFHCTASGVAEWLGSGEDYKDTPVLSFQDSFLRDMYREIEEEVGLRPEDIEVLQPVALAREFLRGGKPQLFFAGVTHLNEEALIQRRLKAIERTRRRSKNDPEVKIEIEDEHYLYTNKENLENAIDQNGFSLEAVANLHYAEQFIQQYITEGSTP